MKRCIFIIIVCLLYQMVSAQSIYRIHYWYDEDYENCITDTSTDGTWNTLLDVGHLNNGIHTIFMLVQDTSGRWGAPRIYQFYKIPNIPIDGENVPYIAWFDQDYANTQNGIIHNNNILLDVNELSTGLHTLNIQIGDEDIVSQRSYIFFKVSTQTFLNDSIPYAYWYDQDSHCRHHGATSAGRLLIDADALPQGIHVLNIQVGEGESATIISRLFFKMPHREIQLVRYEYWLNDRDSLRHTIDVGTRDTVDFIALVQLDTIPIRSSYFHFNPNNGNPVVHAKNDFHFKIYNTEGKSSERTLTYYDINIVDTIFADTLERNTTKVITAPRNNAIHWFKLAAGVGDSLSFHTDKACTLQLFSPSGEEVFSAKGTNVLTWTGCHAWESGDYYLAVHDAEDTGNVAVSYQWIYRYAVLSWDVHRVGNGGISTITFEGNGFASLDTVYLIKGTDTLPALYLGHESNTTTSVFFNFENADTGMYYAVFEYVDETLYKSNVVTVETAIPIVLTSTCSFPSTFLRGSTVTYTYTITNTGNMTAYAVPLHAYINTHSRDGISKIKVRGLTLPRLLSMIDEDSLLEHERQWITDWREEHGDNFCFERYIDHDSVTGDSSFIYANSFFIHLAPYEIRVIEFNINAVDSVDIWVKIIDSVPVLTNAVLQTQNAPPFRSAKNTSGNGWFCCTIDVIECYINMKSLEASVISAISSIVACVYPPAEVGALVGSIAGCVTDIIAHLLNPIKRTFCEGDNATPESIMEMYRNTLRNKALWYNTIMDCISAVISGSKTISILSQFGDGFNLGLNGSNIVIGPTPLDIVNCAIDVFRKNPNCPPTPPPNGGGSKPVTPVDPNEITGYLAESGSHAVGAGQEQLYYTIEFENDTTFATANAHTVVVIDTLDGNVFDLGSFAATSFSIGEQVVSLNGERNFIRTVDMRPAINVLAQVQLEFDDTSGIARWTFRSLDPMTLMETTDPMLGFLPANFNGDGVGQVDFLINRKNSLTDSTLIVNRAHIIFDNEAPIATSTWVNIMDITPPVSSVDSVTFSGGMATVAMSATDNLSGVWRYNVYGQVDSIYIPLAMNVSADTMAVVDAVPGQYLAFITTSIDSAGNIEPLHHTPVCSDTLVIVSVTSCDYYSWNDSVYTSTTFESITTQSIKGCDSVTILHLTVNYSNTATETLTTCDSLTWHGNTYTASTTTPTFTSINTMGCDSVTTLNLTVNHSNTGTEELTVCDSLIWHGNTFTSSTNTPTFTSTNIVGCDSVTSLILTVNYSNTGTESITNCDSIIWHGNTYTSSTNTPTFTSTNIVGCDSVTTLHLIVNYSNTSTETLTACDSLTWHGNSYTASTTTPTFTSLNAMGCDSVITLNLTMNYSNTDSESITTCDSLIWHGQTYTSSTNTPTFTSTNIVGCDSVTTLHLTVNYSNTATETFTACDSLIWHGNTYTASTTTPTFTSLNAMGCDSVTTLNLTINYSSTAIETVTACNSYMWHGTVYTASTDTATFTTTNAAGCDSVTTLHLTIIECSTTLMTACDSYTWHDSTYTTSGTFIDGSDTLILTLHYSSTGVETVTDCDSIIWHGNTYTASDTTSFDTLNVWGCDSTVTLYLTVNYSIRDTLTETAIDSFMWHGQTLTESGEYSYEGETVEGCDSIVLLNLTITHDTTFIELVDGMDIRIFPNPTTGWLTIDAEDVLSVEVFDQAGHRVDCFENTNRINLSGLPTGGYLLRIHLIRGASVKRVILR